MTADFIAFHAAERPDAVAIVDRGREITYAQFHRDLGRFVRVIAELGLRRGSSVAVAWGELYPHWLLLLACERLGVSASPFLANEGPSARSLFGSADLVLSPVQPQQAGNARHVAITPQWLAAVFARADTDIPAVPAESADATLRILRTSGTTGERKQLMLTRRMFEAWVERWIWSLGITRASRYLLSMPFTVTGAYALATAALRAGGVVVNCEAETGVAGTISSSALAITHLMLTPIELKVVLDTLPTDFKKPEGLTLCTIGAALGAPLREKALARIAREVVVYYGSNEIPFIAETRETGSEGASTVFPWVRAEIVDERGTPLPTGKIGLVRLKAETMATGYLDDAETTAKKFRDGWFYPGDIGIARGPRRLQLVGREDELLNLGGIKFSPSAIEAWVLAHATVGDIGACAIANAEGIEEICVAVVNPAHGDAELLARVGEAFRHQHIGRFHIVKVRRIPRNATGKIERKKLKKIIADTLRR